MEITRDYRRLFREAQKTQNTSRMSEIFEALCNEVEIPDLERDQAQATYAKKVAVLKNSKDRGENGKKL